MARPPERCTTAGGGGDLITTPSYLSVSSVIYHIFSELVTRNFLTGAGDGIGCGGAENAVESPILAGVVWFTIVFLVLTGTYFSLESVMIINY